jgi:SSS family solute:Na+ symporter
VVAVFLVGVFWTRANAAGAAATLGLGVAIGVLTWAGNELLGWWQIQFLYAAGLMLVLSVLILVLVSLAGAAPSAEQLRCCTMPLAPWRRPARATSAADASEVWSRGELAMALLLLGLTLAVVLWWG